MNFYTRFGINIGLSFAQAVLASSKYSDRTKAAALKFISAGQEFVDSFSQ